MWQKSTVLQLLGLHKQCIDFTYCQTYCTRPISPYPACNRPYLTLPTLQGLSQKPSGAMYSLPVSKMAAQIMGELLTSMAKNTLVPCLTPSFDRKKREE